MFQWAQKNRKNLSFNSTELEHKKSFDVELLIDDKVICSANGKNIKSAEQEASKKAVKILEVNNS